MTRLANAMFVSLICLCIMGMRKLRTRYAQIEGIKIDLLQRYIFIPLDIFINMLHNKGINNKLDAWLTFLSSDAPDDIIALIDKYPDFKKMYDEVYTMCLNTEKVMNMFSKELAELDRNTVQYMIDEMQDEIALLRKQLEELKSKG